jgi:hypothetical protein
MKKGEKIIQIAILPDMTTVLGLSNLGRLFKLPNKVKKGESYEWRLIDLKYTYEH